MSIYPQLALPGATHAASPSTWDGGGSLSRTWSPERPFRGQKPPWRQRVPDLVHTEGACPLSQPADPSPAKVKLAASGKTGTRGIRQAPRPPGVLSSNSHGYREIFISSRWAPAATGAKHAATIRKPRHPRDKDRSMTYLDLAFTGAAPGGVDSGGESRRAAPIHQRAARDLPPPSRDAG